MRPSTADFASSANKDIPMILGMSFFVPNRALKSSLHPFVFLFDFVFDDLNDVFVHIPASIVPLKGAAVELPCVLLLG